MHGRASISRSTGPCWRRGRAPRAFAQKTVRAETPGDGRNGERDFHGKQRKNDTHASTTDPDARLYRKGPGKEAKLAFMGHALMDNRNGLIVGAVATRASGHAERLAAVALIGTPGRVRAAGRARRRQGLRQRRLCHRAARGAGDPACRAEPERPALGDRSAYHPASRLRDLAAYPQAHRGGLWLGQDGGRAAQDAAPRAGQGRLAIHPGDGRLRSCPPAQTAGPNHAVTAMREFGRATALVGENNFSRLTRG